jgi:hypothetical protein
VRLTISPPSVSRACYEDGIFTSILPDRVAKEEWQTVARRISCLFRSEVLERKPSV